MAQQFKDVQRWVLNSRYAIHVIVKGEDLVVESKVWPDDDTNHEYFVVNSMGGFSKMVIAEETEAYRETV